MAMELKTSWVEADSLNDKSQYILQNASVPVFTPKKQSDGTTYWQQTGVQTKELALVGMHVVGSVKGHPEMIWATIEHKNNAPDNAYPYLDKNGNSKTHSAAYGGSGSSNWLFSDGSATNQNSQTAQVCTTHTNDICPVGSAKSITSTNVTRTNPWGVKSTATDSAKIASQLLSTNTNIFGALLSFNQSASSAINDPRVNYYIAGANWGKNGKIPTGFISTGQGSPYLANSTMETFEQHQGCFGCHSATLSSDQQVNKFSTSHIYKHINKVIKLQD